MSGIGCTSRRGIGIGGTATGVAGGLSSSRWLFLPQFANEFPPLRLIVLGSFGEWSSVLAALVRTLSHEGKHAWMTHLHALTRKKLPNKS